ncbi:MAG TPA: hypothetical protein PLD20_18410 [Blastocatellia bacterium]|nr:hypothetical protein [Blastocatellia bacterium]HMV87838.1 hypothetical protein [Blastocatellia bacterium]HMY71580.1 hypothetical protein [Blastocatellia bacterium]HMZ19916.1 hypothetical protein [Blastocatellia bacterium]HNG32702.1 hypothetical protein [Blastocatellia bacterium]
MTETKPIAVQNPYRVQNPKRKRKPSKTSGRLILLLLMAFIAAMVYAIALFVPVYQGTQQMYGAAAEIVRRGALLNLKEDDVRAQLKEKARIAGVPEDHRIELRRDGRKLTARISYKNQIHFPFFTYDWPVEIRVQDLGL